MQMALAIHAAGGLACSLNGGQQERQQDGDETDDHQQLDQGEGRADAITHPADPLAKDGVAVVLRIFEE